MKKILMIGDANSMYMHDLIRAMKKYGSNLQIDVLSMNDVKRTPEAADHVYKQSIYFSIHRFGKILKSFKNVLHKQILRNKKPSSDLEEKTPTNQTHTSIMWYLSLGLRIIFTKFTIRQIKKKVKYYDVIQVHYIGVPAYTLKIYDKLKELGGKVPIFFWGSDIIRIHPKSLVPMKDLVIKADEVFFYVPKQVEKMRTFIEEKDMPKINFFRFGFTILEEIKAKNLTSRNELINILNLKADENTTFITIGHYGSKLMQHIKVIKALQGDDYGNIVFLLPMTYNASVEYKEEVCNLLDDSGFSYHLFSEFMSNEQVIALRLISDVFIQTLITDGLSGAMLEHLYAGSIVITGTWLKYQMLIDAEINFKLIDNVDEIKPVLLRILEDVKGERETARMNMDKVWELASWEKRINQWLQI